MPHIVIAYSVFFLFSQTGLFSRFLYALHLIDNPNAFPLLIYDSMGFAIICSYLFKQIPFVSIFVLHILKNHCEPFETIAQNLGANFFNRFIYIVFPLLAPSLTAVFLIIFSYDFGSFEVPLILASPAHPVLPFKAYTDLTNADFALRPYAMAANIIISILCLITLLIYFKVFKLKIRRTK